MKSLKKYHNLIFGVPLLSTLSSFERHELINLCHKRSFKSNETIYHQGDPSAGLYFIEEGQVELSVISNDRNDKTKPVFLTVESPVVIGELALTNEKFRKHTAKTLCPTNAFGFFRPDFQILRERYPTIAIKLLESIAELTTHQLEETFFALKQELGTVEAYSISIQRITDEPT